MKIAFLNIYNGVIDRGAETFVKEVASRFSKNHRVVVFQAGKPSGNEKYNIYKIDVNFNREVKNKERSLSRYLFIDYWSRLIFKFSFRTLLILYREKFDVIIPVNGGWQVFLIKLFTTFFGGKMIISGQSGIGWDDKINLWIFPDVFISLSSFAKNWASKLNPFIKVDFIPNGVDTEKFNPKGKEYLSNLKPPIILTVGAFTKTKRIELVIKAVSKIKNVSLLVVGDGDLKEKITSLGNKLMPNRFKLIKVPFEKMPEVYRSANLFTLASESFYSFEIVLVEAMASGLPVVANDDPIRREIVGKAGYFVDPWDTQRYSEVLRKALDTNWEDNPIKRSKNYSWDKVSYLYEKLFEEIFMKGKNR